MPLAQQANIFSNSSGGVGVVSRDHDRADAGSLGFLEGWLDFGARGIYHADQTNEDQFFLQGFGSDLIGHFRHRAISHTEHS